MSSISTSALSRLCKMQEGSFPFNRKRNKEKVRIQSSLESSFPEIEKIVHNFFTFCMEKFYITTHKKLGELALDIMKPSQRIEHVNKNIWILLVTYSLVISTLRAFNRLNNIKRIWSNMSKYLRWSLIIFITQNIRTVVFNFIVIFTTFLPIRPSAFFKCFMSNSGSYIEYRTEPFVQSTWVDCL